MAKSVIVFDHPESAADMGDIMQVADTSNTLLLINKLQNYLGSLATGVRSASVVTRVVAVQATGTITFSDTGAADDTVLINGVTFTAKASGATGNEWNVGASATLSAAALAAAINASATALVNEHVTASADSGVVTITAINAGHSGNAITIAEGVDSGTDMAVSGARLTGGTDGTEKTYSFHR
jgi:phage tail sheath gpL-like